MKLQDLTYRITKIGGRAVSVAVCAMTGMMFMGVAQAAPTTTVSLGSSLTINTTGADRAGDTFFNANVSLVTNGGYNSNGYFVHNPYSLRQSEYRTNQFANIISSNNYSYRLGTNAVVGAVTTGSAAGDESYTFNYNVAEDTNINDGWHHAYSGTATSQQYFGNVGIINRGQFVDYLNAGLVGYYDLNDWNSDGTAKSDNSYTLDYTGTTFSSNNQGLQSAQNTSGDAIDITGNLLLDGGNVINGATHAAQITVSGGSVDFNGNVNTAGGLNFSAAGSASLNGGADLTGSVNFNGNNSQITLSHGSNVDGSINGAGTDNSQVNFEGRSEVTASVGTISSINVKGETSWVKLNTGSGDTTVGTFAISADKAVVEVGGKLSGNVDMGGHYSKLELLNGPSANAGMIGTLDFGMYRSNPSVVTPDVYGKGSLEVGDGVNVAFNANANLGINLVNADNATLIFAGTSGVTGLVGSADISLHNTPNKIYAGADGTTVTFIDRVTVGAGNLNVGPGIVQLQQGLTGNLVLGTGTPVGVQNVAYSSYGDFGLAGTWGDGGTAEVADGQTVVGSITTASTGTGILKFNGSSAYSNDIGTAGTAAIKLSSVTFNAGTAGTADTPVISTITKDVYATDVTIGNGTAYTSATMTPDAHVLGNTLTLAGVNTVLNLDNGFNVGFTRNADGTLSNATSSRVTVQGGHITTTGATLNFAVDAGNVAAKSGDVVTGTSSMISTTGTLVMTGTEKVNVELLGSVKNAATATLIAGVDSGRLSIAVTDNSFVIDTGVAETATGLVMTATRANDQYIVKSASSGDIANPASLTLGTLAATGVGYTTDMQTVFNKLDINEWGFGNTAANLATQVKRLAPVANASVTQSSLAASGLSLNAVGVRMAALRGDTKVASSDVATGLSAGDAVASNGFWVKALGSSNSQDKQGAYDGYSSKVYGLTAGLDNRVNSDFVLGAALGLTKADINQADFRTGDTNRINNTQLMGYGTYNLTTELYLDGALSFARNAYTGVRATPVGRTASSEFNGNQLGARLGLGYGIDLGSKLKLTPMASVDYSRLTQDAYTETGAGAINLAVDAQSTNNTRLGLGARLSNEWTEGGTTYRPEVALNWSQNSKTISNDVNATFVGGGASFVTPGTTAVSRNSVNLGVAMTVLSSKTSSIQIRYDLDKSTGFTANTGSLLARWEY